MSTLYSTTGVVLSSRDWREADRLYTILTSDFGKIEVIGRGARKPLAKLAPHLEFCSEAEFLVVNGKTFETLAGVDRSRTFPGIYEDLSKTLLAHQALHLVDLGTKLKQHDPIMYDETIQWLSFLDESPAVTPDRAGFLLASFSLKLLAMLGYRPELAQCLGCRTAIAPSQYRWHALKGGVVCAACVDRDQAQWFSARPMSDEALKLVRYALTEPFAALLHPRLPGELLPNFHEAVESLIVNHFPTIPAISLRGACAVA